MDHGTTQVNHLEPKGEHLALLYDTGLVISLIIQRDP